MKSLLATGDSWPSLLVRLGLGVAILPHGLQKVFGLFGGSGLHGTFAMFSALHIPVWLGILVLIVETLGAFGLIIGFLTRIAALGIVCDMVGAVYKVHYHVGFFMNWSGQQHGEGFEYHILAIGIGLALIIAGGGKWSIDRRLAGGTRRW
ncbi:MAG TPA: DoxX family protein [Vicinamibacterales bacterium]|jgi:putative oxidoreductase